MMDMKQMGQEMINLYKAGFENSYNTVMMFQEQMERLSSMYWGQMVSLPEAAKKDLAEWTKSYKKQCADFKKVVDDGFKKLETFSA